jgi:hypothetical protein
VERDKALDMALGQIEKQFGKGAIMRMGEEAKVRVASIPTGALRWTSPSASAGSRAAGCGDLRPGVEREVPNGWDYVWSDHGLETDRGALRPRRPAGELHRAGSPTSATTASAS